MRSLAVPLMVVSAASLQLCASTCIAAERTAPPTIIYASQTGRSTLDQGEGGGNPLASAFVELVGRDTLMSNELFNGLVELTIEKSKGFQRPDVQGAELQDVWPVLPKPAGERRVALVLVFSDYSISQGLQSLPGAQRDALRVSEGLRNAGFFTQTSIDPGAADLSTALQTFEDISLTSQVAVLYTTGHGVEVDGIVYLLPGTVRISEGQDNLQEFGIPVSRLGAALRATDANLLLYGGCRNSPFVGR